MTAVVEQMAYAYEPNSKKSEYQHPWHKSETGARSVPVHPDMSPQEMLKKAGLDWEVKRSKAYSMIDGANIYTGVDALYRVQNGDVVYQGFAPQILTMIPAKWQENQNSSFVEFFHEFCAEGSMEMNTMGSLDDGQQTFAVAKLKQEFSILRGKDVIESYMLFSNPHIYGRSISISSVMTRVVCMNTLVAALRESSSMSVRVSHRKKFDSDEVKAVLEINESHMNTYREAADYLSGKSFSIEKMKEYYTKLFPSVAKKKVDKVSKLAQTAMTALDTQPGAELGEGTWWQVYNGATYTIDHLAGRNENTRLKSAFFGSGRDKKEQALKLACEMADA